MLDSEHAGPLSLDDAPIDLGFVSSLSDGLQLDYNLSIERLESPCVKREISTPRFLWDKNVILGKTTSFRLPRKRDQIIQETHRKLRARFDNGWVASGFYALDNATHIEQDLNQLIPALFYAISGWSHFPRPFLGCSAYPAQQGLFARLLLDEFTQHLYTLMKLGGAYAKSLTPEESRDSVLPYVRSLIGPNHADSLIPFALDHSFSLSFFDVAWDYAYVLYHRNESWAALITITDTD